MIVNLNRSLIMTVNFCEPLIDVRTGKPIDHPQGKPEGLTLLDVSGEAVANVGFNETLSAEEKYRLAKILDVIYTNPQACVIELEDLAVIKSRIVKFYSPAVILAVNKILEK